MRYPQEDIYQDALTVVAVAVATKKDWDGSPDVVEWFPELANEAIQFTLKAGIATPEDFGYVINWNQGRGER